MTASKFNVHVRKVTIASNLAGTISTSIGTYSNFNTYYTYTLIYLDRVFFTKALAFYSIGHVK